MARQYKSTQSTLLSFNEVNNELYKIAKLQLEKDQLEAEMKKQMLDIQNKYQPKIKSRDAIIRQKESEVEKFCKQHKSSFDSARSKKLSFGNIGFRNGNFSLKLLSKKFNWELVRVKIEGLTSLKYVIIKKELKKQEIINDFNEGKLSQEVLAEAGCKVDQKKDEFWYSLNWPEIKKSNIK